MKISLKMKLGILLMSFLIVMSVITAATFRLNSLQKDYALIINLAGRQRMLTQKMTKEILGMTVKEKEGLSSKEYKESVVKTRELFDKTLNALINGGETIGSDGKTVTLPHPSDPEILKILKNSDRQWKEFNKRIEIIIKGQASPDSEEFIKALSFLEENNNGLLKGMNDVTGLYEREAEKKVSVLEMVQIWAFIITIIVVIAAFWIGNAIIIKPLALMADHINAVTAGDLTRDLRINNNDEIGVMAERMEEMTSSLRRMIHDINSASLEVSSASGQMSSTTEELAAGADIQGASIDKTSSAIEEINASIKETASNTSKLTVISEEASSSTLEIAASIDEVAKIAEELSYTVEEVSSSITEMAASVREITGHASQLASYTTDTAAAVSQINATIKEVEGNLKISAGLSEATAGDAEGGREAVKKTIDGMRRIKDTVDDAADIIRRLGGKSESIGSILNVINDVAEQTSLLALNAAIIAAQAGEHGKGFAVVADEIKQLAERTTASTNEIAALIDSVQTEASNAVKSVEAGGKTVESGVALSYHAGDALEKILSSANSSRHMIEEIARASAEQLRGSQQANEAMEKITDMITKVYKAIEDQEKGSAYIAKAAEKMKDAAGQVRRATKEQSKGGELISRAIENISSMVSSINRATQEQAKGGHEIVKAVEEIKEITTKNIENVKNMRDNVETLITQTAVLDNSVKKFNI